MCFFLPKKGKADPKPKKGKADPKPKKAKTEHRQKTAEDDFPVTLYMGQQGRYVRRAVSEDIWGKTDNKDVFWAGTRGAFLAKGEGCKPDKDSEETSDDNGLVAVDPTVTVKYDDGTDEQSSVGKDWYFMTPKYAHRLGEGRGENFVQSEGDTPRSMANIIKKIGSMDFEITQSDTPSTFYAELHNAEYELGATSHDDDSIADKFRSGMIIISVALVIGVVVLAVIAAGAQQS